MFGLLGGSAEFFVARGNTTFDIVVFAFAYVLVPPFLAAAAVWVLGRWLLLVLIGLLVAALVLPPLGDLLSGSAASIAVALAVGAGFAVLYARVEPVRTFLTFLSPAPLVFLVFFLVISPVSDLLRYGRGDGGGRRPGPLLDADRVHRARRAAAVDAHGRRRYRRGALPEPRPVRRRRDLVPQRDDGRRQHGRGGAGAAHRRDPRAGRPADVDAPPAQPVHAVPAQPRPGRRRADHRRLPGAAVPGAEAAGARAAERARRRPDDRGRAPAAARRPARRAAVDRPRLARLRERGDIRRHRGDRLARQARGPAGRAAPGRRR